MHSRRKYHCSRVRVLARSLTCAACGVGVVRSLPIRRSWRARRPARRIRYVSDCRYSVVKDGQTALRVLTIFCLSIGITPRNRKSEDYRQKKSKHSRKQQEIRLTVRRIYFAPICITAKKGQNREKTQKKSKQNCFHGYFPIFASYNGLLSPSTP